MNAQQAKDITERRLSSIDNSIKLDEIINDLNEAVQSAAELGLWDCKIYLSNYVMNDTLLSLLIEHCEHEGFTIQLFKDLHETNENVYKFYPVCLVVSWARQLHDGRIGYERTKRGGTDTPPPYSPPPYTGGTPTAATSPGGGESVVDSKGEYIEATAASAAA